MNIDGFYSFEVTGDGPFPRDMLRYDDCDFLMQSDKETAGKFPDSLRLGERTVTVIGTRKPTIARWQSFGWRVGKIYGG